MSKDTCNKLRIALVFVLFVVGFPLFGVADHVISAMFWGCAFVLAMSNGDDTNDSYPYIG